MQIKGHVIISPTYQQKKAQNKHGLQEEQQTHL